MTAIYRGTFPTKLFWTAPWFDFNDTPEIHALAPVAYEQAKYFYEQDGVRQEIHKDCLMAARIRWEDTKPWYCSL